MSKKKKPMECRGCGRELHHKFRSGRPKMYCSERCRVNWRTEYLKKYHDNDDMRAAKRDRERKRREGVKKANEKARKLAMKATVRG